MDFRRNAERARELGVRHVPTFIFVSGGKEVRRSSGSLTRAEIRSLFRSPDSLF